MDKHTHYRIDWWDRDIGQWVEGESIPDQEEAIATYERKRNHDLGRRYPLRLVVVTVLEMTREPEYP